jgi:hypothetical protein
MDLMFFPIIVVGIFIYFIPVIIAGFRDHSNQSAIFFLNLFTGWTFIGWVACFVWAFTNQEKPTTHIHNSSAPVSKNSTVDELERLAALKEKGLLTEDEFYKEKQKILNE